MLRLLLPLALIVPGPALAAGGEADAALVRALAADDVDAAVAALAQGADADAVLEYGETPLARAVETQDPSLLGALLAARAKPDQADAQGLTPLMLACERGNSTIVDKLLSAGANPRKAGADGATPLAMCARFADADAVRALMLRGAKIESVDVRGHTPLMWAASAGRLEAVSLLLKAGATVNRATPGGFTPLFFALASGKGDVVSALIAAGADVRHRGPENTNALQMALYQKNWDAALQLVGLGADLAELDREGHRPLHVAAAAGQTALIAALLAKGAAPDGLTGPSRITWVTEANFGMAPPPVQPTTPLLMAARAGKTEAMRQLVAAGGDKDFVDGAGVNVVLAAAGSRSAAALVYALDLSPDINTADKQKNTALHLLVGGGFHPELEAMIRALGSRGARLDLANAQGKTAVQVLSDGLATVQAAFHQVFPVPLPSGLASSTK